VSTITTILPSGRHTAQRGNMFFDLLDKVRVCIEQVSIKSTVACISYPITLSQGTHNAAHESVLLLFPDELNSPERSLTDLAVPSPKKQWKPVY